MQVYIGVDGGGTKTRMVAVTEDGVLLADLVSDGSNVNRHGWERATNVLGGLFATVRAQVPEGAEVASVSLGLAGVDREPERRQMLAFVQQQWPQAQIGVENDARIALSSNESLREGIVLIAGTGSIAFGVNEAGEHARVGGWGYLIGDEGSGYDIGRQALAAVIRSYDGREQPTVLVDMILETYQLPEPTALIPMVYAESFSRERMAEVARVVLKAAAEGDPVSRKLLSQAADQLGQLVEVLRTKLAFSQDVVPVVVTGGLLHRGSLLVELLGQRLTSTVQLTISDRPPVVGAVRLAQQAVGGHMSERLAQLLAEIPV